ncbi:hypothetical protein NKJ88_11715 [Mesorhizobium sp. M0016]|uniref:hypothetical protein n=1 Tax=Mesorhizobium sp. M0016 TaxID=2956843 RepID=UPI0033386D76
MSFLPPPDKSIKVTKQSGAFWQVEAAIEAFELGRFECAVTLAGAAEGMLPENPNQAIFSGLVDHPKKPTSITRKDFIAVINLERDWLKHLTPDVAAEMEITLFDAAFMVVRAMARLEQWSPKMEDFKSWYMAFIRPL